MRRGAMVFCGLLGISAYAAAAEKQRPSDIFDQVAAGDSWTVVKTEPDGDVSRASDHVVSSKPVAAPCAGGANGGADAEAGTPMSWWELGCGVVLIGWVPGLIGYKILRLLGDTIHDVRVTWRRSAKSSLRLTVKRVAASVESLVDKPSQRTALIVAAVFLLYAVVERPQYGGRLYGLLGIPQLFTKTGWAVGVWLGYTRARFGFMQFAISAVAVYVFMRLVFGCFASRKRQV